MKKHQQKSNTRAATAHICLFLLCLWSQRSGYSRGWLTDLLLMGCFTAPPPPPATSSLCCYLINPPLCNNPIKGIDLSLGLIRHTLSGKKVVWWVGRGMVRAMAAGGDAVKPSGKSSVEIHQRAASGRRKARCF